MVDSRLGVMVKLNVPPMATLGIEVDMSVVMSGWSHTVRVKEADDLESVIVNRPDAPGLV